MGLLDDLKKESDKLRQIEQTALIILSLTVKTSRKNPHNENHNAHEKKPLDRLSF